MAPEFLTDHDTERVFQVMVPALDEFAEGSVHETLVVAAACGMNLLSEPPEQVIIDPDRDSSLARWETQHGASDGGRKVVFPLHLLLSYRFRSAGVAERAEIILARFSRQV